MMKDDGCCKNTHENMFAENDGFVLTKNGYAKIVVVLIAEKNDESNDLLQL